MDEFKEHSLISIIFIVIIIINFIKDILINIIYLVLIKHITRMNTI